MSEERKASLGDFMKGSSGRTIDIMAERPPEAGSVELDQCLRFNSTGPGILKELFMHGGASVHNRGVQCLTRQASLLVHERLHTIDLEVLELHDQMDNFDALIGELPMLVRRHYTGLLDRVLMTYGPFSPAKNVPVWFWSETIKKEIFAFLNKARLPQGLVYPLYCGVFSELGGIGEEMRQDLYREYRQGLVYLKLARSLTAQLIDLVGEERG